MVLDWSEGQPFSSRFGDVYFSSDSGMEETRHVFLQGNCLAERFASLSAGESFCIGETGFGTGLNFLCAWQLFEQYAPVGASLDFFSVEKFPLREDELQAALALWPDLHLRAELLHRSWHRRVPGWNRWSFACGRVRLTLAISDVDVALPQLPEASVNAWFLDGFSPAKNPDMWSEKVLANIARASRRGATLATYTSAGWVRRGLQDAGFEVEKVLGFGRKREMVRGMFVREDFSLTPTLSPGERELGLGSEKSSRAGFPLPRVEGLRVRESPRQLPSTKNTPRTALIIGGGIAGCAAAYALAQRGIAVTLIERATQLASGASGNPRGILHARFGVGDNPLHRFVLAAYGHALGLLDQVLPVDGTARAECGLLQLACNEVETKRIERLKEQDWPEHLLQFVGTAHATKLAGIEMKYGGLWFPSGGWIVPAALCANLVNEAHITLRLGHQVETLEKMATGWRVSGKDTQGFEWEAEADVVLACSAHSAKKLPCFENFPLTPVRGQITAVPQTVVSTVLQAIVCGDGYCAPGMDGVHIAGATHAFDDESTKVRAADHLENLANIAEYAPALYQALNQSLPPLRGKARMGASSFERSDLTPTLTLHLKGGGDNVTGRASIRCSAPGSMPLVGKVQDGLYCSLAHGTRGLITAGLAGEILAAQICGQLPPLPESIIEALAPSSRMCIKG